MDTSLILLACVIIIKFFFPLVGGEGTYHGARESNTNEESTNDGNDPMDLKLSGPAVNHQSNWERQGSRNKEQQSVLGPLISILLRKLHMELITVMPSKQLRSTTQSQANVAKTRNALAKSVSVLEHLREGGEEQVDDTIDETHVQRHDDTDGALVEELNGAADDLAHELGERKGGCAGSLDVGVSGFFAEFGGFAVEEDRAIGFTEENEADDGHDTALFGSELNTLSRKTETYQNSQQPEDPSPVGGLGEETSSNGTNYGSNQHAQTEDTHNTKPTLALPRSHK